MATNTVDGIALNSALISIADAIRAKGGTSASLAFPIGFISAVNDIPTGGGSGDATAIIEKTISGTYENGEVTSIGGCTFRSCEALTTVSFPIAITIGSSAFAYCSSLTTISFPAVTTIGVDAFFSCTALTTVSFPAVTTIGNYAFNNCSALNTISFPVATSIGSNAFTNCSVLTTASFPSVTSIFTSAFRKCFKLLSLFLTGSSRCNLENSNAFTSTPIAGYTASTDGSFGTIYVPSSLLTSYQIATNWTYFSSRFSAIENYVSV